MATNNVVDILVNDRPITTYNHDGKLYIEGRPNSPYKIRIRNPSWKRMKVIVSVDGLSVLDGKPAKGDSKGYVINGYGDVVIDGWRTDNTTTRQFVFGAKRKSYSSRVGEGTVNVGVIGVMMFEEVQTDLWKS